ncbi:MAG TPA: lipase [Limnobacter sp.]|nr:lipase [Limnobacter sp.]
MQNELPFVNKDSLRILTATSGLTTPVTSNFGFMALLKGGRSREIVIATRGTASKPDMGTNLNAIPMRGPTGHLIHSGFGNTFKSYVQQMKEFLHRQNLGFSPTAVHCMGHSLGGALANLNAAACAELGLNAYLYTIAAPRVGMVPYAEHLSKKMIASHVYRVANEADVVTMVPCYPYFHSPYVHGTYLLDGGWLKVNPWQHKLSEGYESMVKSTWAQLKSQTRGRQQQMQSCMLPLHRDKSIFEQISCMQNNMFSSSLLKMISLAINEMLRTIGAQNLLTVSHYATGAFTVLDQMAEMLARYAAASNRKREEVLLVLNAVMAYLGRTTHQLADASVTTIRWVFGLLNQSVTTMAGEAIRMVEA